MRQIYIAILGLLTFQVGCTGIPTGHTMPRRGPTRQCKKGDSRTKSEHGAEVPNKTRGRSKEKDSGRSAAPASNKGTKRKARGSSVGTAAPGRTKAVPKKNAKRAAARATARSHSPSSDVSADQSVEYDSEFDGQGSERPAGRNRVHPYTERGAQGNI